MVKMTMIARVTDGLPLAEGLDDGRDMQDSEIYKQQVKALFKNLSKGQNEVSRMSIETGPYVFHYIIEGRVCYLTMCDRSYPKKLAFQYLEDLKNEFERVNGAQIETAARPYAFIKFDTFIQRTKRLYQDTRTQRNIAKLNDELFEVHQIMTRNVQEVLGVGEKLDQVSQIKLMQDIGWLRSVTKLPILIKGILTREDAIKAVEVGVDGIVVSNHGARQLDYSPSTISVLEEVVHAVAGKVLVLFDGGVRRGTDVFKALALGAQAVLIGRPVVFGLAAKGEYGVRKVVTMLKDELELTMALSGCPSVKDITRSHVRTEREKLKSML